MFVCKHDRLRNVSIFIYFLLCLLLVWCGCDNLEFLFLMGGGIFEAAVFSRYSPVMGGGSTTDEGPKNEGMSLDVVTGVLRSPGCGSEGAGSSTAEQVAAGTGLPLLSALEPVLLYKHVSKLNTLK